MPNEPLSSHAMDRKFRDTVLTIGSQRKAAEFFGVSCQYINDLMAGRREISERIAGKLGYYRVVTWHPDGSECD